MTVQQLIDELMKVEDKTRRVVVDCVMEIESVDEFEDDVELRY